MSADTQINDLRVLELSLHGRRLGYLAGFQNGRNVLSFADEFRNDRARPTFSLITHPSFPNSKKLMSAAWTKNQRLHPVLSNLLPEGALRELIALRLKTHINNEFHIFAYLGQDLPGALLATPLAPEQIPERILASHGPTRPINFEVDHRGNRFSLAGVQMKFSMQEKESRYTLPHHGELGNWIIKTPSSRHKHVPLNEYSSMSLAALAGVDIPEIRLVELDKLDRLPQINLPDENLAFAIKRFDRDHNTRIHMEDFAQILVKYPQQKYDGANYEQIGRILYDYSGDGPADAQQFARRLLANILLANGDAHLKNWSLLYQDQFTPRLSPAYDIVTTAVYFENETDFALNLAKTKAWFSVSQDTFQNWANRSGIPWRMIKPHIDDAMQRARTLWPAALHDLPMDEAHKIRLKAHWRKLHPDFRIETP